MTPIRISGLTKEFRLGLRRRRSVAVDGLDLEVEAGEIFGFLGPNGAGKTTTIKILLSLIYPTRGTAWLLGRETGFAPVAFSSPQRRSTTELHPPPALQTYQASSGGASYGVPSKVPHKIYRQIELK